ncbi:MAG: type I-U CRISPR-associated protein Cas8c [Thermoplasmata archaeon]|nr:type I-U CRISPR-associated protein Cas8c [Thermoplasmata archaeon]
MSKYSIPVDIFNPGQVFACLGFMEAADVLFGDIEGGFDWTKESDVRFVLCTASDKNPFEEVLGFLANAKVIPLVPKGYDESPPSSALFSETFPASKVVKKADGEKKGQITEAGLPCRLESNNQTLDFGHWADSSSRDDFKQFAGKQSAYRTIIPPLLCEIKRSWNNKKLHLDKPFNEMMPIKKGKASFMLDARAAWTPRDLGFSRDKQGYSLMASPIVELLGAIGLNHARPLVSKDKNVQYGIWGAIVPPNLARPVLGGVDVGLPQRLFSFIRNTTGTEKGEYKQVTFSREVNK